MKNHATIIPLLAMTALAAALGGCSSAPVVVRPGDRVSVDFTCRLPNGELAATTRPDSDLSAERKSAFYLPRKGTGVVSLLAGEQPEYAGKERVSFEDEIMKRLGQALPGLREGEQAVRELQAERYTAAAPMDRFVRMALVRKRDKELRLTPEEFTAKSGKAPEVGQRLAIDPLVPGRVSEVNDKEVVVRFGPEQGTPLTSPFGPVTFRETPTNLELEIKAEKGRLVRTGGMAGRISAVEEDSFSIDYGHPFGGETLRCDLTVASVKPAEKKAEHVQPGPANPDSGGKGNPEARKVLDEAMARMLSMSGRSDGPKVTAQAGDLVTTDYTVTLEDGSLVATTREKVAQDQSAKKVAWYREPAGYAPLQLVAGRPEVMPGLAEGLIGMKAGEQRRITLTPDKAFGTSDPQKMQQFPCRQSFPATIRMPAEEYVKRFSSFPTVNREVELLPYFKSRVADVTERDVALEFLVADGATFDDSFGSVLVNVAAGTVTITMRPRVGAPFQIKDAAGIITATDGTNFTVDFNNPLAGKTIVLDLETVAVAATTPGATIEWVDEHDAGLARARQEGKPVFMMLHADWCSWCKKSFSDTFPDPRITALKDRFVWVRVNSDKELKFKQQYGQEGFPMMVLLNPDGSVLKKIDGYRDARSLREEIRAVLN